MEDCYTNENICRISNDNNNNNEFQRVIEMRTSQLKIITLINIEFNLIKELSLGI